MLTTKMMTSSYLLLLLLLLLWNRDSFACALAGGRDKIAQSRQQGACHPDKHDSREEQGFDGR